VYWEPLLLEEQKERTGDLFRQMLGAPPMFISEQLQAEHTFSASCVLHWKYVQELHRASIATEASVRVLLLNDAIT